MRLTILWLYFSFFHIGFHSVLAKYHEETKNSPSTSDTNRHGKSVFVRKDNMRVKATTGAPVAIYRPNVPVTGDTPLEKAFDFLLQNLELLQLDHDILPSSSGEDLDLSLHFRHLSTSQVHPVWTTVRLQQIHQDLPVYEADVAITINKDDFVIMVMIEFKSDINVDANALKSLQHTTDSVAEIIVVRYGGGDTRNINIVDVPSIILFYDEEMDEHNLAWYATYTNKQPHVEYEIIVRDNDGKLMLRRDLATGIIMEEVQETHTVSTVSSNNAKHLREKKGTSNQHPPSRRNKMNAETSEIQANHFLVTNIIRKLDDIARTEEKSELDDSDSAHNAIVQIMDVVGIRSDRRIQTVCISSLIQRLVNLLSFIPEIDLDPNSDSELFTNIRRIFTFVLDVGCPDPQPIIGNVFYPDPLASSRSKYGDPGFSDNDDADSEQLTAQLVSKSVDARFYRGTYFLTGMYAQIVDEELPLKGIFNQTSHDFSVTREDDGFEAFNCYYHITNMLEYVDKTLGITIRPTQYDGGAKFDPHGANGGDNSHYFPVLELVAFGEGGVDDAEDADVIIHEVGHLIHHWITGHPRRLFDNEGISEGFGDYLANSYTRVLGKWTPDDEEYYWIFKWDGHNDFFSGRSTNYTGIYPIDLIDQIHTDGQIWSTCNMKIWDVIGRENSDKAHLIGLSSGSSFSTQEDIANAVLAAAVDLGYRSSDITSMRAIYESCGYIMIA